MTIKNFKKLKIPDRPGVYFFQRGKFILYIGKATSLRDRVRSYFGKDLMETRGPGLVEMLLRANKIKWKTTDSVLEALILETGLIKKYQPKYNTKDKSDKSFNYVCLTKEKLPRVVVVRGRELRDQFQVVYGPFPNSSQLREALKIIRRIFPFLDEKSKNYLEFYRQINLVPDLDDRKLYLQNIGNIKLFFAGKKQRILQNLKKEMKEYAKAREFEKAGEIKRQTFALQHINDVALLKEEHFARIDFLPLRPSRISERDPRGQKIYSSSVRIEAYDIAHLGGKNMVGVMTVLEGGELAKNEYRKFKVRTQDRANDTGALIEVLERRFAHPEWVSPSLVVVDGGVAQINAAEKVFTRLNLNIPVASVLKDERHKPKDILGDKKLVLKYKKEILLANSEAHRFAIAYHKKVRGRGFLK